MSAPIDNVVIRILDSVILATTAHFQDSLRIKLISSEITYGEIDVFTPSDMTAIIGVSGPVNALIAFNFDNELVSHLLEIETAGLDVPGDELDIYRHDVIAELANVVLGHSTQTLAKKGEAIGLSPPIVLDGKGSFRRPKGSFFACVSYRSIYGLLDIYTISPMGLSGGNLSLVNMGVK
jgi:CheY-specific phosphatase CheX